MSEKVLIPVRDFDVLVEMARRAEKNLKCDCGGCAGRHTLGCAAAHALVAAIRAPRLKSTGPKAKGVE